MWFGHVPCSLVTLFPFLLHTHHNCTLANWNVLSQIFIDSFTSFRSQDKSTARLQTGFVPGHPQSSIAASIPTRLLSVTLYHIPLWHILDNPLDLHIRIPQWWGLSIYAFIKLPMMCTNLGTPRPWDNGKNEEGTSCMLRNAVAHR